MQIGLEPSAGKQEPSAGELEPSATRSPVMQCAKLRQLCTWYAERPRFDGVPRWHVDDLQPTDWPQRLAEAGTPVIVSDYLARTPLAGLDFEQMKQRAGGFELNPAHKPGLVSQNFAAWLKDAPPMRLQDYLEQAVLAPGPCDPGVYKLYRNIRISQAFQRALGLLRPTFLKPNEVSPACIWIGKQGSYTSLHTDPNDNFVLAVIGCKRFYVYPPCDIPNLYCESVGQSAFLRSPVDPRAPDLERYPRVDRTRVCSFVLRPGELLFLPLGWPHFVECVDSSFTYNYWLHPFQKPYFKRLPKVDGR